MKDLLLGEAEKAIQFVNAGENTIRLPKTGTNVNMRTKLGFTTIAESESWFYLVELPKGWRVEQDSDIDNCSIIDAKDRKRGNIFLVVTNNIVVAAYTTFYRRFYAKVEEFVDEETVKETEDDETREKGRVIYLLDRQNPDYKVKFCFCDRCIDDFEEASDCENSAIYILNKIYPGCNDVDNWEDHTLEKFKDYFEEWNLVKCRYK